MKVFVRGLNACLQRKADVQRYKDYLRANGHEIVDRPEECDIILLWGCAFRQDQRDHSLHVIDLYKSFPAELVVCGCLPSIDPKGLAEHFQGRFFEWKEQESKLIEIFGSCGSMLKDFERPVIERCLPTDLESFRKANPEVKVGYTDQFLKMYVSEGCNFKCAYCAERLAFPKYRSIPLKKLVSECKRLMGETGQKRIVLWADSLGDYGNDCGHSLPQLLQALLKLDSQMEVGLENIHPKHFLQHFGALRELLTSNRIFLLNLPIQSASDRILKLMNREYTRNDLERIFETFTKANFNNCETDIIVGFPTETESELQETLSFVIRYRLKYVKISGYLETAGMDSVRFAPKVSPEDISHRVCTASRIIGNAGILCNYDNNATCQERFTKELVNLWQEEMV